MDDRLVAESRIGSPSEAFVSMQLSKGAQVLSVDFKKPADEGLFLDDAHGGVLGLETRLSRAGRNGGLRSCTPGGRITETGGRQAPAPVIKALTRA